MVSAHRSVKRLLSEENGVGSGINTAILNRKNDARLFLACAVAIGGWSVVHGGPIHECHVDFRNVIFYNTLWKIHRLTIQYSFIRSLMIGCGDPENTALDLT